MRCDSEASVVSLETRVDQDGSFVLRTVTFEYNCTYKFILV